VQQVFGVIAFMYSITYRH